MEWSSNEMREPTTTLWKVLKVIFIIINVLSAIAVFLLVLACIALGVIIATDSKEADDLEMAIVMLVAFAVGGVLQAGITVIGFIGICRLNLRALRTYFVIIILGAVFNSFNVQATGYFFIMLGNMAAIAMMYFLIDELKKANGKA